MPRLLELNLITILFPNPYSLRMNSKVDKRGFIFFLQNYKRYNFWVF